MFPFSLFLRFETCNSMHIPNGPSASLLLLLSPPTSSPQSAWRRQSVSVSELKVLSSMFKCFCQFVIVYMGLTCVLMYIGND